MPCTCLISFNKHCNYERTGTPQTNVNVRHGSGIIQYPIHSPNLQAYVPLKFKLNKLEIECKLL